jgi:uncharacterized membrane protein (UPF0127 family)
MAVHTLFTFLKPDILFLNGRGRVLAIHARVPAWLLLWGPKGTKDTLEVPGGISRRQRIRVGSMLTGL